MNVYLIGRYFAGYIFPAVFGLWLWKHIKRRKENGDNS
jgi:hypothetical protein